MVDQGFSKVGNDAQLFKAETVAVNTLIQRAAGIGPHTPRLASLLAQAEIDRLSGLLLALSEQEMILTTGDRDCLLGLVRSARESIDIVSVDTVDPVGDIVPCFWESYLGGSSLDLLWHAARRNVRVRRLFVIEHGETVNEPTLRQICDQARMGIQVRLIDAPVALHATGGSLHDFALFDDAIRYEVASTRKVKQGDTPAVPCSRLVAHVAQVNESIQTYEHTWISATPWSGKDS